MNNNEKKKNVLLKIFAWFLGLFLILGGIAEFAAIPIGVVIMTIAFGVALLPPIDKMIKGKIDQDLQDKFNVSRYKSLKIFIGIIIVVLFFTSVLEALDNTGNINNNINNSEVGSTNKSNVEVDELEGINEPQINIQENITLSEKNGTYIGDIVDKIKNDSNGKFEFKNGYIYEGSFINNQIEGKGKLTIPNIGVYEGNFSNGKRNGYGKMTFANGDVYEGTWSNDEMSGDGTYLFSNGDKYVGAFSNNKFNGNGIYTFKATGKEYKGTWLNNSYKG